MNALRAKLSARRGETIAEVLAAILVAGLAVALLVGMISAASRLNASARRADEALYQELAAAEGRKTPALAAGQVTLTIGDKDYDLPVSVYGTEDGLTAYGKAADTP